MCEGIRKDSLFYKQIRKLVLAAIIAKKEPIAPTEILEQFDGKESRRRKKLAAKIIREMLDVDELELTPDLRLGLVGNLVD